MYQPSMWLVLPGLSDSNPGLTTMGRASGTPLAPAATIGDAALGDGAPGGAAQPASMAIKYAKPSQRCRIVLMGFNDSALSTERDPPSRPTGRDNSRDRTTSRALHDRDA